MPKSSAGTGTGDDCLVEEADDIAVLPKKLGMPPASAFPAPDAFSSDVLLEASANEKDGLLAASVEVGGLEKKEETAGGLPAGVVEPTGLSEAGVSAVPPEKEKIPLAGEDESFFLGKGIAGGESGAATIEPVARGDEALGRVDATPSRAKGPPARGRLSGGRGAAGVATDFDCTVLLETFSSLEGFKPAKEMPEKEGNAIFEACSSSSISGRSSSLAEYRPEVGVWDRE